MGIYLTDDNKEIIVDCHCLCEDGIHIKIDNEDEHFAILTYTNGNFYRDQKGAFSTLRNKLKKIWAIIRNKDYYYSEIIMTPEEFENFKAYINQCG